MSGSPPAPAHSPGSWASQNAHMPRKMIERTGTSYLDGCKCDEAERAALEGLLVSGEVNICHRAPLGEMGLHSHLIHFLHRGRVYGAQRRELGEVLGALRRCPSDR